MSKGNVIVVLIAGIVGGALLGWAVAFVVCLFRDITPDQATTLQSTGTGIGSLVGLIVCGVFAAVSASSRKA